MRYTKEYTAVVGETPTRHVYTYEASHCPSCGVGVDLHVKTEHYSVQDEAAGEVFDRSDETRSPSFCVCEGCFNVLRVENYIPIGIKGDAKVEAVVNDGRTYDEITRVAGIPIKQIRQMRAMYSFGEEHLVELEVDGQSGDNTYFLPRVATLPISFSERLLAALMSLDEATAWPVIQAVQDVIRQRHGLTTTNIDGKEVRKQAPKDAVPLVADAALNKIVSVVEKDKVRWAAGNTDLARIFSEAEGELHVEWRHSMRG